jgi:hypothetical protein
MTPRRTNVLFGSAGALVLLALVAFVIPPGSIEPREPLEPANVPGVTPSPSEDAAALLSYQEIVGSNIFAADRSPPATRYVPPELAAQPTAPVRTQAAPPRLRLYGVATGPSGAVALIDADLSIPGAEIYRLGDSVRDFTLEEIADTYVVLRGPSGSLTLPLETPRSRR